MLKVTLFRYNIISITELYEGIKFQCPNTGQRFMRNETLKAQLDRIFAENNEIRRRKRVGPLMYPSYAVAVAAGGQVPPNSIGTGSVQSMGSNAVGLAIGVMSENRPQF